MGVFSSLGVNLNTTKINPAITGKIGITLLIILIFIIIGIITFFIVIRKINKKKYIYKVTFAREVNGKIFLVGEDFAKELVIPYTSIKVFWLKERKTWSPKLIYDIGRNSFLIFIGKGGEWINTDLRFGKDGIVELNDELKPSRDYANENLKELIQRNWTDKNKNWLKENSIFIFLIILGIIIIIALVIGLKGSRKMASSFEISSQNYLEASKVYSQSQENFLEFLKENFKNSGVLQTNPTT